MKHAAVSLCLAALLCLCLAAPARATTYVMMSDEALADQTPVISVVRVAAVEPTPDSPATDYLVEVERVVKGYMPGSTVVVRVPGGVGPDGRGLKIWGAPELEPGERALLFMAPAEDGTYRIQQLMLGAFHERELDGARLALRDLSGTSEVGVGAEGEAELRPGGRDVVRDLDAFVGWLEDREAGIDRPKDYVKLSASGSLEQVTAKHSLLTSSRGHGIRWFRFDDGQDVAWRVHSSGQPGLGLDVTIEAFRVALDAWNSDPGTNVAYTYVGTTGETGGLEVSDDVNSILFEDPRNEHVEGSFKCGTGGVIAAGGPYFFTSTRPHRGRSVHEAVEADIVTNDGAECFFRNRKAAEEVFAHELGHTLGLGHSEEREALMRSTAHNDGRGAQLTDDDRAGLAGLYGSGPSQSQRKPAAPAKLAAVATSKTQVQLTWRDKANNEDEVRVEVKVGKGAFREILTVPADSTGVLVEGLKPGTAHLFRLRAKNGAGFSTYSNRARARTPRR